MAHHDPVNIRRDALVLFCFVRRLVNCVVCELSESLRVAHNAIRNYLLKVLPGCQEFY